MFKVFCVLRVALSAPYIHSKVGGEILSGCAPPASQSSSSPPDVGSSAESERAAAVERLSTEVFGRGNRHLKNVETLTALPEGLHSFPEVCFIGKPNCGKSSVVSCLLHNARLGKAGATGGTTRLLQFFNVGDALLLVDTPGYGGWKGRKLDQSLKERANAFSILFRYLALRNGSNLKRVYWLMEASSHSPVSFQARDEELLSFLTRERIPFSVVLTKIDRHWRSHAEERRRTTVVRKDGLPHPGNVAAQGGSGLPIPLPEEGVARNVREVFEFLGTDAVPVLGVSANRRQPGRSLNLELLQHDIMHYCVQDLQPGEALTFANLHKLSYAPPTAARIQEVQLQYPVESFVVPQNNTVSLAEMVAQHEEAKAQFLARNVSAAQLTAKDVEACHLGSTAKAAETLEDEATQRSRLGEVLPSTTFFSEIAPPSTERAVNPGRYVSGLPSRSIGSSQDADASGAVSVWREPNVAGDAARELAAVRPHRRFHRRPSLAAKSSSASLHDAEWHSVLGEASDVVSECSGAKGPSRTEVLDGQDGTAAESLLAARDKTVAVAAADGCAGALSQPLAGLVPTADTFFSPTRVSPPPALPAMLDPNTHYVTAIDGTRIPRSLISVSVEQLAVNKEDELTHFATKSGAGAYEELLLLDHEGESSGAPDPFTETSDFARLPEAVQSELLDTKQYRTRSAARKQEERFLAKYVEKKRKERSIYMQAEGYMCPWLAAPEKRDVVRGLSGGHALGKGGAVIRGLKQHGFGGRSFSARTMKNRGRATKKTGSWAA